MSISSAETVVDYWFADATDNLAALQNRMRFWFAVDRKIDKDIRQRFGQLPTMLNKGHTLGWLENDVSLLAKVLILDQFTRNMYRGTAQAFAYDELALKLAKLSVKNGILDRIHPLYGRFIVMPYEHSEDLTDQEQGVVLGEYLHGIAPTHLKKQFMHFIKYAHIHRNIIQRFGRFPHRNAVLNRECTEEESEYLQSGGERFGQ